MYKGGGQFSRLWWDLVTLLVCEGMGWRIWIEVGKGVGAKGSSTAGWKGALGWRMGRC